MATDDTEIAAQRCDCCGSEADHLNYDQTGESAVCDECLEALVAASKLPDAEVDSNG